MKRVILLSIFLSFVLLSKAQIGGFGHFMLGNYYSNLTDIEQSLRKPLGNDLNFGNWGNAIGGSGMFVFDRFLIGINGYNASFDVKKTTTGRAEITGGYGEFDLGYMLANSPKSFTYIYAGYGAKGTSMTITNKSDTPIDIGGASLTRFQKETFVYGGSIGSLGISFNGWTSGRGKGMKLGLDIGMNTYINSNEWEYGFNSRFYNDNGRKTINFIEPKPTSWYIRVTIGGGSLSRFFNKKQ